MAAETKKLPKIFAADVLTLTVAGENELKGSSTALTPSELEMLVLLDGSSTVAEVSGRVKTLPAEAVAAALEALVDKKLAMIASKAASGDIDIGDFLKTGSFYVPQKGGAPVDAREAREGVSSLQKNGYYVRIARRAAAEHKAADGGRLTAVVVEDEPSLAKLLRTFLGMEGFATRLASNRAEILAALRTAPVPDLVLLDVMLPDVDGFEILEKLRAHPAFKNVAVIMLTAKATRAAVLKGLSGGADGYITKPFEVEVLMKAVAAVLGKPET
jgi:two-component system OmpR family response regulator